LPKVGQTATFSLFLVMQILAAGTVVHT